MTYEVHEDAQERPGMFCRCRAKDPRYPVHAKVHVHGTPGSGVVIFIEPRNRTYYYTVEYHLPNGLAAHKTAAESDIILIDSGVSQP